MSDPTPATLTDAVAEVLSEYLSLSPAVIPLAAEAVATRIAAHLASVEAEVAALRGVVAAVEALAESWRYKGEFGFGAWQEGQGPDIEGQVLDGASSALRATLHARAALAGPPALAEHDAEVGANGSPFAAISAILDGARPPHVTASEQLWRRVTKVCEESGEVWRALSGWLGENVRKGPTHTQDDLLSELLDTATAALCAWAHLLVAHAEVTHRRLRAAGLRGGADA